jgi:hypothetical protein
MRASYYFVPSLGFSNQRLNNFFLSPHLRLLDLIVVMGICDHGGTVVKVLRYKSEGRWFDSRWCHWNFSLA